VVVHIGPYRKLVIVDFVLKSLDGGFRELKVGCVPPPGNTCAWAMVGWGM